MGSAPGGNRRICRAFDRASYVSVDSTRSQRQPRTYGHNLRLHHSGDNARSKSDQAIERNPVVYRAPGLITPQCLLPRTIVEALRPEAEYAAQIKTNVPHNRLANDGAGELLLFRLAKVEVKLHNENKNHNETTSTIYYSAGLNPLLHHSGI